MNWYAADGLEYWHQKLGGYALLEQARAFLQSGKTLTGLAIVNIQHATQLMSGDSLAQEVATMLKERIA